MKILLIDDDKDIRMITRENLKDAGFTNIIEAASPSEAVQVLVQQLRGTDDGCALDLIVSDYNMPGMSQGYFELLHTISVPAVVYSSGFHFPMLPEGMRTLMKSGDSKELINVLKGMKPQHADPQ